VLPYASVKDSTTLQVKDSTTLQRVEKAAERANLSFLHVVLDECSQINRCVCVHVLSVYMHACILYEETNANVLNLSDHLCARECACRLLKAFGAWSFPRTHSCVCVCVCVYVCIHACMHIHTYKHILVVMHTITYSRCTHTLILFAHVFEFTHAAHTHITLHTNNIATSLIFTVPPHVAAFEFTDAV
jgi:hypothetical protein